MAIYTPRGLKVRIAVPYAFGLMARLHPRVPAFRVLKTTEGIESIPGFLTFVAAIIAFVARLPPARIAATVLAAYLGGLLLNHFGLYVIPGLVGASTLFSYFAGYGVLFVALGITGYVFTGWRGVLAFLIARFAAWVLSLPIDFAFTKKAMRELGHPLTASERHFFNAYRLHANRVGATTDLNLSESELEEANWAPTLAALARDWPEVVARFTTD